MKEENESCGLMISQPAEGEEEGKASIERGEKEDDSFLDKYCGNGMEEKVEELESGE